MEIRYQNKVKRKNPKDKQKTLNKPSFGLGGLQITRTVNSTPMQRDSLETCWIHTNDTGDRKRLLLINTARVTLGNFLNTVHGTQGPKMAAA